jgi:hypothetical protein
MSGREGESHNIKVESLEAKNESQSQTVTEQQAEKQPQQQAEAKIETRLPTPSIYPIRLANVYNEIVKLADEPLTLKSIMDRQLINQILLAENIQRLQTEAKWKFNKWLAKRGKDLSPDAQERMATHLWIRELIDALAYYINGAFGTTGYVFIIQTQFMLKLYSKIKDRPISQWCETANEILTIWKSKQGVNPKALHASAHLLLKLMAHLTQP